MPLHFVNLDDLEPAAVDRLLVRAEELRGERALDLLKGKAVVLVFFNPSLRTRVSMELAAQELGARVVTLDIGKGVWNLEWRDGTVMDGGAAEHVREAAKVLARYGDVLALRSFPGRVSWEEDREDPVIASFQRHSDVPLVNMESCLYHPCQALADVLTIRRALGREPGKIVLTWANHPKPLPMAVPSSFALAALQQGWSLTVARPEGYDLPPEIMERMRAHVEAGRGTFEVTEDRDAAFAGARIVYAKSWGSLEFYGRPEEEAEHRRGQGLGRWIVDEAAMARTDSARFMHCLPVRRGVVVADAVLDSEASIVLDEAENRLHAQKAVLADLLADEL